MMRATDSGLQGSSMVAHGREAGPRSRAEFRLMQETADTHRRSLVGGAFYLAGWLLVGGYGGAFAREPVVAWLVASAFVLLALARHLVRAPSDPARARAWLAWNWSVVLGTAAIWGAVTIWAHREPAFDAVHHATLICTVAYATAIAHTYAMRPPVALGAIALLFGPTVASVWLVPDERPVALALSIYCVYLLLALSRSHREYDDRAALDWLLREQRDDYERMSRLDPLTGIANRRSFQDAFADAAARARVDDRAFSLLMLDLDHFKDVNDRHGHAAGDDCLVAFARMLALWFDDAFVARLGGEEFAVLLDTGADAALARAERFRDALSNSPLALPGRELGVSVSIGVDAYAPDDGRDLDEFLRQVDRALYRAKALGRDRVCDVAALALSR